MPTLVSDSLCPFTMDNWISTRPWVLNNIFQNEDAEMFEISANFRLFGVFLKLEEV
jgi:hypothetical protein